MSGAIVLPVFQDDEDSNDYLGPSPRQVLRIAINLKGLIDKLIPITIDDDHITGQDSIIINDKVLAAVKLAAGGDGQGKGSSSKRYQASLIYCLLKVSGWYYYLMLNELSDNSLYAARRTAAETIAAILIEREEDDKYLFLSMLCHRYTINLNDVDSAPANVLELAVDMHCTPVIASSGYQRCIKWLWRGWIVQSSTDPSEYVLYKGNKNSHFRAHFDPDRIKTPLYQNILEIIFSFIYLGLYTYIINTDTSDNKFGAIEVIYYLFTLSFVIDELQKFSHIGYNYLNLSNGFNDFMYGIIILAFSVRLSAIGTHDPERNFHLNTIAYRILSLAAPMMWIRLLLFLDVLQFVGAMVVVIRKMMKESLIFFFLLGVIMIGFLQAFIGLDQADGKRELTTFVVTNMFQTVLSGPDFDAIERFAYPYGNILYYAYTFIVVTILLNILIALYSQAYSDIVENSTDEYLAQYSAKVLRYVRAPDYKVFVPPTNLIELALIEIPLKWCLDKTTYERVNDLVMVLLYAPVLFFTSRYEVTCAKRVQYNRSRKVADDDNEDDLPWDLTDGWDEEDEDGSNIRESLRVQKRAEREDPTFTKNFKAWSKSIDALVPPIVESKKVGVSWETYEIFNRLDKLTGLVHELSEQNKELREKLDKSA